MEREAGRKEGGKEAGRKEGGKEEGRGGREEEGDIKCVCVKLTEARCLEAGVEASKAPSCNTYVWPQVFFIWRSQVAQ